MVRKVYASLKDSLKDDIESFRLSPGDLLPPEHELSSRFGISRSSVRQALSELEQEHLVVKRPGIGTFVQSPESRMLSPVTSPRAIKRIGVDIHTSYEICGYDHYFLLVSDALLSASRGRGLEMVMIGDASSLQSSRASVDCDGFIITHYGHWTAPELSSLTQQGQPLVAINASEVSKGHSFVCIDNARESFRATEYLIRAGHRDIAFVALPGQVGDERYRGYLAALARHAIQPSSDWIIREALTPGNASSLEGFITHRTFSAMLIASESLFEFIFAPLFFRLGVRVPQDLSVLGFDYQQRNLYHPFPSYSHIRIPVEEMVFRALDILTSHPSSPQQSVVEAELVIRNSILDPLLDSDISSFGKHSESPVRQPPHTPPVRQDPAMEPAQIGFPCKPEHYPQNRKFQGVPSVAVLPDGTLLATWYTGGVYEGPDNFCVVARSRDGGRSWTDPWLIIEHPTSSIRTFDPNLWVDPQGGLWMFWAQSLSLRNGNTGDGRLGVWAARCPDPLNQPTAWEQPIRIANGVMMNKPTVLKDGTWAFPTALWNDLVEHGAAPARLELRKEKFSNLTVSEDQGRTFSLRGGADVPERCYDEHQIIQLKDGRLWMLVRTIYGIGQSFSTDEGRTWSLGTKTIFHAPNSRFCITRLTSGRLLFISNLDDSGMDYHKYPWRRRYKLTAYLSDDDGSSWSAGLLLDARDSAAYPDAAEDPQGAIFVIHDCRRTQGGYICLSKITEQDILAGKKVTDSSFLAQTISSYPYAQEDQNAVVELPPLEAKLREDEPFTLQPPPILNVTDESLFPENSDFIQSGGFDRTQHGRIWITWTAGGDDENAYLMSAWSDDEGVTWTHPKFIIPNRLSPHGFKRSHCCSVMWNDPLGRMWWIFDCRLGSFDGRSGTWCAICENPDADEPCWGTPFRIWHGVSLNRPQILSDGTWIMAISLWPRHRIYGFQGQDWPYDCYTGDYTRELDPQRKAWIFASTDQGKTWNRRGGIAVPQREFDEPSLIERKDGSLLMYLRTYYGLAETESFDQGNTWEASAPSTIQHPPARLFTCRLKSGKLLMVRHDRKLGEPAVRNNLTAYLSDDDGAHWYGNFRFESRAGVSYPDGFQHPDGRIFIQYDHQRKHGSLQMSIFTEEDVAAGKPVSGKCILGRTIMSTNGYGG